MTFYKTIVPDSSLTNCASASWIYGIVFGDDKPPTTFGAGGIESNRSVRYKAIIGIVIYAHTRHYKSVLEFKFAYFHRSK